MTAWKPATLERRIPAHEVTMRLGHEPIEADAADRHVSWAALPTRAKAWRLVHTIWAVAQLACLAYVWSSAFMGRRDRAVWASVGFLMIEGGALVIGRGNCPVGPLQARSGDPVPFFELVLPPRAAKAAVPVLAVVSISGIAALVVRRPGLVLAGSRDQPRGTGLDDEAQ